MRDKRRKIYFINVMRNHGGGEIVLQRVIEELVPRYRICLISVNSKILFWAIDNNIETIKLHEPFPLYGVPVLFYPIKITVNFLKAIYIASFCIHEKTSIIHINGFVAGLYFAWIVRIIGYKTVVHFHDLRMGSVTKICKRIICFFSNEIIAVSNAVKSEMVGIGIDSKKIHVIYNGLPDDFFSDR
jgi:hypothetical protein